MTAGGTRKPPVRHQGDRWLPQAYVEQKLDGTPAGLTYKMDDSGLQKWMGGGYMLAVAPPFSFAKGPKVRFQ
jgi:hypothetical protein